MNQKKIKALFFLLIIFLLIVVLISVLFNNDDYNTTNNQEIKEDKYVYDFNETLDLENTNTFEEDVALGTSYPDFGIVSDYYENTEKFYKDNKLYIASDEGYDIYSTTWMDESLAKNVKEPTFGVLEKFVLKSTSASARYSEVKMKDVTTYINELSGLGFNKILKDNKNQKNDYYIYSASKDDVTVTLNYEKGSLYIEIF